MNDTTHMENIAEDLISYKLQREGILVTKPKFDRDGADLIAFLNISDGAKFCRIQCKGRSIKNNDSSIIIDPSYAQGSFVVVLFIEDNNSDDTNLFLFFPEDIINWKKSNNKYILYISKNNFSVDLDSFRFDTNKINKIKEIISKADINYEMNFFIPTRNAIMHTAQNGEVIIDRPGETIKLKKGITGTFETTIVDKGTGIQSAGPTCPGDPQKYDFNGTIWVLKSGF